MAGLSLTTLEWAALAAALALALLAPGAVRVVAAPCWAALGRLARTPGRAVALFALLGGLGALACAELGQRPIARVHDESSYLLAADTFAAGRLVNPQPRCAEELEAFHVITHPVYASKYPSGQGLALALGQRLGGDPTVALWWIAALFVGATMWMLFAVLPPRWALVGASIALFKIGVTSYWAQTFWGGSLTAAGAALAFGAYLRIARGGDVARDAMHGLALGVGVAVLALTRPFEGAVACVPLVIALAAWAARLVRAGEFTRVLRVALATAVPLLACALWMALLNRAITGSPWRMPYFLHDEQYAIAPPFLWQSAAPTPTYASAEIGEFWRGFAYEIWERQQSLRGFFDAFVQKLGTWWTFFIGATLTPALIAAPFAVRTPALRLGAVVCACVALAVFAVAYDLAHYVAPATPWLIALLAAALRRIATSRFLRARRRGWAVCSVVLVLLAGECVVRGARRVRPEDAFERQRARIERELTTEQRKCVVVVRYGPGHRVHDDWVYNGADPQTQVVLWARDHGTEGRERLAACYPDRIGYLLEVPAQGAAQLEPLWP